MRAGDSDSGLLQQSGRGVRMDFEWVRATGLIFVVEYESQFEAADGAGGVDDAEIVH